MADLAIWLDSNYASLLWVYFVLAVATFVPLFWISAPYGRFSRAGFGPQINAMYAWLIMEMPAVLAMPVAFLVAGVALTPVSAVFAVMWLSHYVHRTFVYPVRRRAEGSSMPILLVFLAIVFNLINGTANGWFVFGRMAYDTSWFFDPRFFVGLVVFVAGMAMNMHSDRVLLSLKRQGKGYQIPNSGLHTHVASPNYLGEIIEWIGWAIATWSIGGLLFAVYTFANLAPRARSNLIWYRETFPDYPADRKALIPRIW